MSALLQYSYAMLIFVNDIGCGLSVQRKYWAKIFLKPFSKKSKEFQVEVIRGKKLSLIQCLGWKSFRDEKEFICFKTCRNNLSLTGFTVEKPTSERDREEEEKKVLGTLVDNWAKLKTERVEKDNKTKIERKLLTYFLYFLRACDQSYKQLKIIIYNSWGVLTVKLPILWLWSRNLQL